MLFSYLPHNGCGTQLDHRISELRLMLPPLAFNAVSRADTGATLAAHFEAITGNGKNARVRR